MWVVVISNVACPKRKCVGCLRQNGHALAPHFGAFLSGSIRNKEIARWRVGMIRSAKAIVKQGCIVPDCKSVFRAQGADERKKRDVFK